MARDGDIKDKSIRCSFCGKTQNDVKSLIAGPGVYICDQCVELCEGIIADMAEEKVSENELDFHWCIGPGLTYCYTSQSDFETLINKFQNVYSIGVRGFGLLLDDIPNEFQYEDDAKTFDSIVDAHIDLINRTYAALTFSVEHRQMRIHSRYTWQFASRQFRVSRKPVQHCR